MINRKASLGVILEGNQLLLTKRKDVPVWVLPGGGQEPGESPEETCIREVEEETGLQVRCIRPLLFLVPSNCLTDPTSLFLCEKRGGTLYLSDECSEVAYFPLDALPPMFFWPHKKWLEEGLAAREAPTRFASEITWSSFFCYFLQHPLIVMRFLWTKTKIRFT